MKTRTDIAAEQEKVLKQREREIGLLQTELNSYTKVNEELAVLKAKNDEKEQTIKSNEQGIVDLHFLSLNLHSSLYFYSDILFEQATERPSVSSRENQRSDASLVFHSEWP